MNIRCRYHNNLGLLVFFQITKLDYLNGIGMHKESFKFIPRYDLPYKIFSSHIVVSQAFTLAYLDNLFFVYLNILMGEITMCLHFT